MKLIQYSTKEINYTWVLYVNNNKIQIGFVTYYPLYVDSLWTGVHNLTRKCYHLLILPLKSLSYRSHLLCDQLTYFSSKKYMSNFTKGITVTTDFMITYPLDYPRWYIITILWDIIVPLLRIPIVINLHQ